MERIGEYTIRGVLGEGGMGVVYEASHPRLDHPVALKLLLPGASEVLRARFRREATALARLDHPNLVGLLDFGQEGERPWIAMRKLEGQTLEDVLRYGPLPPEQVAQIGASLCRALSAVHGAGLLHRDLKPENVIRAADGAITLTDFGLTKDLEIEASVALSRTGAIQGTPGYWAPEQASGKGKHATPATDIYGLGATLYALLTGKPPAEGSTFLEIVIATRERRPERPSATGVEVPEWLEEIVLRALAKEPEERFESAAAMLAELERHDSATPHASRAGLVVLGLGALVSVGLLVAGGLVLSEEAAPSPLAGADSPLPSAPASALASPTPASAAFSYQGRLPMGVLLAGGRRALLSPLPRANETLSAQPEGLRLRDGATGEVLRSWPQGAGFVSASPSGETAAFSQRRLAPGELIAHEAVVWISAATGEARRSFRLTGKPLAGVFGGEDRLVLGLHELGVSSLEILDLADGRQERVASFEDLDGRLTTLCADRGWVGGVLRSNKSLSGGRESQSLWSRVLAWDPTGTQVFSRTWAQVSDVALASAGSRVLLAVAVGSDPPQVIELPSGTLTELAPPGRPTQPAPRKSLESTPRHQLAFASGGRRLLLLSGEGRLLCWNLATPAAPPQVLVETSRTGAFLSLTDEKVMHATLVSEVTLTNLERGQVHLGVQELSSLLPPER